MNNLIHKISIVIMCIASYHITLAQTADELFQLGIIKEEAEGNLQEAIEIFSKVVEDVTADRNLRAMALLQVGSCYDKMGQNKAVNAYEKLIRDFADQKEFVSIARTRLMEIRGPQIKHKPKLVSEHLRTETNHRNAIWNFSPDGQYYAYMNWDDKELYLYDLTTHKAHPITKDNDWQSEHWSNPSGAFWSADSKEIVYTWQTKGRIEAHIVKSDGTDTKTVFTARESEASENELPWFRGFTGDGNHLMYTVVEKEEDMKIQKLYTLNIKEGITKEVYNFGSLFADNFSCTSAHDNILFSRRSAENNSFDIFALSLETGSIQNLTNSNSDEKNPSWSPGGQSYVFTSKRSGTNDLYSQKYGLSRDENRAKLIEKNLGRNILTLNVGEDGSIFYAVDNSRRDIYTLDIEAYMRSGEVISERITGNYMPHGGFAPNYSKDGRYISYLSYESNFRDYIPSVADNNLGNRNFINIYDTKTGNHRELPTEIYENHHWSDINEYVPDWSRDGSKLLLHGRIRENYEGGFFMVDVQDGEITPAITQMDSPSTKAKRAGRCHEFSSVADKFYYMTPDWKNLREYDYDTQKDSLILNYDAGFFYLGHNQDEDKFYLINRFGRHVYDRTRDSLKTNENQKGWCRMISDKLSYCYGEDSEVSWVKSLYRESNENPVQSFKISFTDIFPDGQVWLMKFHPLKEKIVFDMKTNNGTDLFRLKTALQ